MTDSDTGRCTGHCCRCFTLSVSYEELKQSVAGELRHDDGSVKRFEDDEFVLDMLIPLGRLTAQETQSLTGGSADANVKLNPDLERFTCRHFDGTNCTVYDDRPSICRKYAVSHPKQCEYAQCTLHEYCSGATEKAQ